MAIRDFKFIVGPETSTLPTASSPTLDDDFVTLGYADDKYARRKSWETVAANPAAVKAIVAADRQDGSIIWVVSLTKFFYFDSASTATGDDVTVITPTAGTGRWLQVVATAAGTGYDFIVSNPAISGYSTHTTIGGAISAASAGNRILVLRGTYAENVSVNKRLKIEGGGYDSYVNGTWTFTSASDFSVLDGVRIATSLTLDSGANGITVTQCLIDTTDAVVDNGTGNYIEIMETV